MDVWRQVFDVLSTLAFLAVRPPTWVITRGPRRHPEDTAFTTRTLLALTLVIALILGWWRFKEGP
jgi:hypothetical protein